MGSPPQSLKQRVYTCLTKLSDRDTYALAASELDAIAKSLEPSSFSMFISCIQSTDSTDKSPVRKQCINLLATLSATHGNTLSPHLPKMLTALTRRLRDPDSAVRATCVTAAASIASNVTKPSFETFLKAFTDSLFTEQDWNAQISAAMCLAAAIEASPDPEPMKLGRMMTKFEKLLKSEGFRGKAGVLSVIGSVVSVGGVHSNVGNLRNLMNCVTGLLSSEDWATRKAAAEVLLKLAVVERNSLGEFKVGCLKLFESRRFDKVKAVREVMNQMLEAWKQVPDISDEDSPPLQSLSSSKENTSDGRFPSGSRDFYSVGSANPQTRKLQNPASRLTPPDVLSATKARKKSPLMSSNRSVNRAILSNVDRKASLNWKIEIAATGASSLSKIGENDLRERDENIPESRNGEKNGRPDAKRALFKSGSRVTPYKESSESTVGISDDHHKNHKDSEDLSKIRDQLVQIEKQQSSLVDLLQRFIGTSQNGLRALETRVHGLELALDEISYDLAITSGRMTKMDSQTTTCCLLPSEFLSSRFRKKPEVRYSNSRFASSTCSPAAMARQLKADRGSDNEVCSMVNRRFGHRNGAGFVVNPLASVHSDSRLISEVAH